MDLNIAIQEFLMHKTTGNLLKLIIASFDDSPVRNLPDYTSPEASIILDAVKSFDDVTEVGPTKPYVLERVVRYFSFTREGLFWSGIGGEALDPIDLEEIFEAIEKCLGADHVVTARAFVLAVSCAREPMFVLEQVSPAVRDGLSQLFDAGKFYSNDVAGDLTDNFVSDDSLAAARAYLVKAMVCNNSEDYANGRVYYERGIHATVTAPNSPRYMQLRAPTSLVDMHAVGRRLRWGLVEALTAMGATEMARRELTEAFVHEHSNATALRIGANYRTFVAWCLAMPGMIPFFLEEKLNTTPLRCRDMQGLACLFLFKAHESEASQAEDFLDLAIKYWARPLALSNARPCSGDSVHENEMLIWFRRLNKELLRFMCTVKCSNFAANYEKLASLLPELESQREETEATGEKAFFLNRLYTIIVRKVSICFFHRDEMLN